MASGPSYAVTPTTWCGLTPATLDVSWSAPTHTTTLGTAGANGTKISQIDVIPAQNTIASGLVNIFLYDGTNYHLHESVTITAATISTTASPTKQSYYYDNLVLPSASWTLVCTNTVAGNVSGIEVNAYGASL